MSTGSNNVITRDFITLTAELVAGSLMLVGDVSATFPLNPSVTFFLLPNKFVANCAWLPHDVIVAHSQCGLVPLSSTDVAETISDMHNFNLCTIDEDTPSWNACVINCFLLHQCL